MLPPGFVGYHDGKGLDQPLCRECVHYADEKFTARGICWEYGAYVSLYSSCRTFERRLGSNAPIVGEGDVKVSYPLGLANLTK